MAPVGAVLAGIVVGGGLACAAAGLVPTRPPLASALAELRAVPGDDLAPPVTARRWRRWVEALARRTPPGWVQVPPADLAVLGWSRQRLQVQKVIAVGVGLALPGLFAALATATGRPVPVVAPVVALALAAGLALVPDMAARSRAADARRHLRHVIGVYFELVALERAAEGGAVEALFRASTVGDGWAFRRIADTLNEARVNGTPPWVALGRLGETLAVTELVDLADVVAMAGDEGTAIFDTLLAKARSIRAALRTDAKAKANARSELMIVPAALLIAGVIALYGYPAVYHVTH